MAGTLLPSTPRPDAVVIGGGTAGCVLARRLVDAGVRVLMLEAGPDARFGAVDDPGRMHELWHGPLDWDYHTTAQAAAHDRRLHLPRGRLVSGSHAFNAMVWVRGNPVDYDTWEHLGNAGWSWREVEPVFERMENRDGHGDGPQHLLTAYRPDPIHEAIAAAAIEAGIPFNEDYNGARQDGVSYMQFTIRDGRRYTTADAYLGPVRGNPLLTVCGDSHVDRLLLAGGRCVGVRFSQGGETFEVHAGEVFLAAGALGSPAILERSGIGDPRVLRAAGVDVRVDLPAVGENLQDHWLVPVVFSTVRPPLTSPGLPTPQSHLFWRSREGLPAPDVQPIHFGVPLLAEWMLGPAQGFSLMAGLIRPASRGSVHIAAGDPLAAPVIDPRVLSAPQDLDTLVAAVRLCRAIGAQAPLAEGWGAQEIYPASCGATDADLRDYVRETVVTYHHQSGTCAMGPPGGGVVDNRLRVHGVTGLRIADASVMPVVVSGNTNAPVAMIAERAAGFVLTEFPDTKSYMKVLG